MAQWRSLPAALSDFNDKLRICNMSASPVRRIPKVSRNAKTSIVVTEPPVRNEGAGTASGSEAIGAEGTALLAYSYWEARGCQGGSPEDDWLRAEQQLRTGG
jgi:hypothetical protein